MLRKSTLFYCLHAGVDCPGKEREYIWGEQQRCAYIRQDLLVIVTES